MDNLLKDKRIKSKSIYKFIKEHNNVCHKIYIHNKFWKNYYLALNYTLIPFNLMFLHQISFENLNIFAYIVAVISFISQFSFHLMFNLMTASINNEAKKSYKILIKILQKFNNIQILQKLKVCFITKWNH